MRNSADLSEHFVEIVQEVLREHPRLLLPDERIGTLRQQLHDLKTSSRVNPEDRVFLFRIMAILQHSQTPPAMGELSTHLGIPLSSVTRMVDGLVRAKFAERVDDPNDRRIVRLRMTARGEQFIAAGMDFLRHRIRQLLDHFSPDEQAQLLRLTTKLIDSLRVEQS